MSEGIGFSICPYCGSRTEGAECNKCGGPQSYAEAGPGGGQSGVTERIGQKAQELLNLAESYMQGAETMAKASLFPNALAIALSITGLVTGDMRFKMAGLAATLPGVLTAGVARYYEWKAGGIMERAEEMRSLEKGSNKSDG